MVDFGERDGLMVLLGSDGELLGSEDGNDDPEGLVEEGTSGIEPSPSPVGEMAVATLGTALGSIDGEDEPLGAGVVGAVTVGTDEASGPSCFLLDIILLISEVMANAFRAPRSLLTSNE